MTRLMSYLVLLCTAFVFLAGGALAAGWRTTSSCKSETLAKTGANSTDSVFTYNIQEWKPTTKYLFHAELSWDSSLQSAQGRIYLKKKDTSLNERISDWYNPPGDAAIDQDITRYIDGDGTYYIVWEYYSGASVCIMKSEINPTEE